MRRICVYSGVLFLSIVLMGCTSLPTKSEASSNVNVKDDASLRLVAVDLVSVLGQLPGFDPWTMTVQISPIRTSYGKAIADALTDAGYGIQRVSADQGLNHVEHSETTIIESTGKSNAFEIKVRGIRISRNYKHENHRWGPSSPLLVYGAEPTPVKVFDGLHSDDREPTRFSSGVIFHSADGEVIESREVMVDVVNDDNEKGQAAKAKLAKRALSLSQAATFTRQRASFNGEGNYKNIAEVILSFPSSDPGQLGQNNKQAIAELIASSNSDTDRYIIQGCVKNKTLFWDGTESISLERQQRVNKELLISGVKAESIKELGCFEDNTRTGLPQQSVSVVLKRLVAPL